MSYNDYAKPQSSQPVEITSSEGLMDSNEIHNTPVFSADGQKVGLIYNITFSRTSGNIVYAVVSDTGFLGFGAHRYLKTAWHDLSYQDDLGGFISNITKEKMQTEGRESAEEADMQIW